MPDAIGGISTTSVRSPRSIATKAVMILVVLAMARCSSEPLSQSTRLLATSISTAPAAEVSGTADSNGCRRGRRFPHVAAVHELHVRPNDGGRGQGYDHYKA